tara:strand:- start:599 stop:826 length:228 start_codon:yes stop_codon:yes gene_type:complete
MNDQEDNLYRQYEPRIDEINSRLDIVDDKIPELQTKYHTSGYQTSVIDELLSYEKEATELRSERTQIWNKIKTGL